MTETNTDSSILWRLHQLGTRWEAEDKATVRHLDELQMLARQTATELDRLTPRSGQAAQRLRDMEAHIESYSRADIKDLYSAALESQMRVFMMQMQQEQIEHKQRVLGTYRDALAEVIALARQIRKADKNGPDDGQQTESAISAQDCMTRVIQAQEEERRRTARQIHDGPAQALANLVLRAEICERLMANDAEQARRELSGLKKLVTQSLQETRGFIFDLRPMILDDLGLVPTLRRYCDTLSDTARVPVRLSTSLRQERLPAAKEIVIFRVVQEALRNALAHGTPTEVSVILEDASKEIQVTVQDDGKGCDGAAALQAAREGRTAGLSRIEQYVRSVNGSLTFWSEPERGARVAATFPWPSERPNDD